MGAHAACPTPPAPSCLPHTACPTPPAPHRLPHAAYHPLYAILSACLPPLLPASAQMELDSEQLSRREAQARNLALLDAVENQRARNAELMAKLAEHEVRRLGSDGTWRARPMGPWASRQGEPSHPLETRQILLWRLWRQIPPPWRNAPPPCPFADKKPPPSHVTDPPDGTLVRRARRRLASSNGCASSRISRMRASSRSRPSD